MEGNEIIPYGKISTTSELGRLIRARRKKSGVTQEQAAALIGVGVRFLSELERGKATAELGKVLRVLERIGLDLWIAPRGERP
jgi:y4mF family transcriptional regulator